LKRAVKKDELTLKVCSILCPFIWLLMSSRYSIDYCQSLKMLSLHEASLS
jgi:hypothetical protein